MTADHNTETFPSPSASDELPADFPARRRVMITTACRDCDALPRVPEAGACVEDDHGKYQLMHNGVKVAYGGYYGEWMAEIIRRLRGHHEPQEERAFHEVLKHIGPGATMVELGGFWAYYSLWFHHAIPGARNWIVEPDPVNIQTGKSNFALNGCDAHFTQASVGRGSLGEAPFCCESDWQYRPIPQVSVDDLIQQHNIARLDVLHADIQGAELDMLSGARRSIERNQIRFVFVSTHHHSISGNPLTHQLCREFLIAAGGHVLADHTVAESFSGDGLLVASLDPADRHIAPIEISYNRAANSLFRETEYDLAEAWHEIECLRIPTQPPLRQFVARAFRAMLPKSQRAA